MRIVYHPAPASLTDTALRAWLAATLASMASPPAPGIALDIGQPDYPYRVEQRIIASDRSTQGGQVWSRVTGRRLEGTLTFSNVHSTELAGWRAWYEATDGYRRPFAVELPDGRCFAAVAPGEFPLTLVSLEICEGALALVEWL